jgi:hypothetical protein
MAVTQLHRFADLLLYLEEDKVPHKSDVAQQVVELPVIVAPLSGVVYIRWELKLPYIQIIHPFVAGVPEDRVQDVESAICHANTTIALPGLGFEYGKRFVYMRLCVPVYEEGILATSFKRQVLGVLQNARDFLEPFRDVVAGRPGSEILALAVKHKAQLDATTVPPHPLN